MHDQTLINLLTAKRLADRLAEPYQNENSNKLVIIPAHVWVKMMDAIQAVLQEEIIV
jgi:hypothetical protein